MLTCAVINFMLLSSDFLVCVDFVVVLLETTNQILILTFCWMFTKRVKSIATEFTQRNENRSSVVVENFADVE